MIQKDLFPKINNSGTVIEPFDTYYSRVRIILPNFPEDVVRQWFYDHPDFVIDQLSWLNYNLLRFEKATIRKDTLENIKFKGTLVETLIVNITGTKDTTERMQRLIDHFRAHGTWPKPVIFLTSLSSKSTCPSGFRRTKTLHLVEGHWRVAAFFLRKDKPFIKDEHQIWKLFA